MIFDIFLWGLLLTNTSPNYSVYHLFQVRCKLSGHEMPGKLEAVTSYIKGKKYLRLKKANADHIQKCLVHLDPSNKPNRK